MRLRRMPSYVECIIYLQSNTFDPSKRSSSHQLTSDLRQNAPVNHQPPRPEDIFTNIIHLAIPDEPGSRLTELRERIFKLAGDCLKGLAIITGLCRTELGGMKRGVDVPLRADRPN